MGSIQVARKKRKEVRMLAIYKLFKAAYCRFKRFDSLVFNKDGKILYRPRSTISQLSVFLPIRPLNISKCLLLISVNLPAIVRTEFLRSVPRCHVNQDVFAQAQEDTPGGERDCGKNECMMLQHLIELYL